MKPEYILVTQAMIRYVYYNIMSVPRVSGGSARAGRANQCYQWDTMMSLTNFSPHITVTTVGTQPLTQWPQFGASPLPMVFVLVDGLLDQL